MQFQGNAVNLLVGHPLLQLSEETKVSLFVVLCVFASIGDELFVSRHFAPSFLNLLSVDTQSSGTRSVFD
jgi:hypothetical protein